MLGQLILAVRRAGLHGRTPDGNRRNWAASGSGWSWRRRGLMACGEAAVSEPPPEPTSAAATDVSGFPAGETRPAPDFTLEAYQGGDLLGGDTVQFSQILAAGKPVVLNFWAAQCPPCRVEMPDLDHAYQAASDRILMVGSGRRTAHQPRLARRGAGAGRGTRRNLSCRNHVGRHGDAAIPGSGHAHDHVHNVAVPDHPPVDG